MTTHVFIVDSRTFKIHLEHLFAGTGGKDFEIDFNNSSTTILHHKTEDVLGGLIADASRIRSGDFIIFYLQQNTRYNGKFFGVFKATTDFSFLDNFEEFGRNQYLYEELDKSLTFRILIEPFEVFPEGVTEWESLDNIQHIAHPYQMLWSLIYRKLKGKRGNTMITLYESERLVELIRNKNNNATINLMDRKLSYDENNQKIITLDNSLATYLGRQEVINILPRLISKYSSGLKFEPLLQAYILKNIGTGANNTLDRSIIPENYILEWIGNEVSCGVGMQSIDILLSAVLDDQHILIPIELKAEKADVNNIQQIQRYVDWIQQYYIPNVEGRVRPILIAKEFANKDSEGYIGLIDSFERFNQSNVGRCESLVYIEYIVDNDQVIFNPISY